MSVVSKIVKRTNITCIGTSSNRFIYSSTPKANYFRHPLNRDIWVQYGNPPRCFLVGEKGPCPDGMKLAAVRNSSVGVCKCECYFYTELDRETFDYVDKVYYEISKTIIENVPPFCYDGRNHHAFYKDKCYKILTQVSHTLTEF